MNESLIQQFVHERRQHLGFLRVLTRDAELAEELFQEVSLVVITQAGNFDQSRDFGAWVRGIARNLYRGALRKRRAVTPLEPELMDAIDHAYDSRTQMEQSERSAQLAQLSICLEQLPSNSRELLQDRYTKNRSSAEMAEARRVKSGAIDTALSRIRTALLTCIQRRSQQGAHS